MLLASGDHVALRRIDSEYRPPARRPEGAPRPPRRRSAALRFAPEQVPDRMERRGGRLGCHGPALGNRRCRFAAITHHAERAALALVRRDGYHIRGGDSLRLTAHVPQLQQHTHEHVIVRPQQVEADAAGFTRYTTVSVSSRVT